MADASTCEIEVRVTPKSSRNAVEIVDGRIKVWVTAPPVDGQANEAVCLLLAKTLGLSKSSVVIIRGHTWSTKWLRVVGMDSNQALAKLRS